MAATDSYNDKEIFRLISEDDEAAFTECFHRFTPQLLPYINSIIHSDLWAEDLVQNVFTKVWNNRAQLDKVENPSGYLYRIAANLSIDFLKHHAVEVKAQYRISQQLQYAHNPGDQEMDMRFYAQVLNEATQALTKQQKLVYQLRYMENLSYIQIADRLGLSRNTVRNHLAAAMDTVRIFLKEKGSIMFWLFYVFGNL